MGWFIGAVAAVALVAAALWLFAPTLRLIGRPDFEPTPKDDVSVFNAQQTGMVDGGQ